jgi:hypothetical protein
MLAGLHHRGLVKAPNPKIQIPKKFQIPIFKLRNAWSLMFYYQQLWIDLLKIWSLGFVWSLAFGCWSFRHGVPSRNLTSNLEFRTLPLCALSYGDKVVRRPVTLRIPALI